jgi:hypothetical protein
MEGSRKEPWKRKAPKRSPRRKLTPPNKARAKALARAAGRAYPNLVDNMRVAREQKKKDKS